MAQYAVLDVKTEEVQLCKVKYDIEKNKRHLRIRWMHFIEIG